MKARGRLLGALVAGVIGAGCGGTTSVTTDAGAPDPVVATASAAAPRSSSR